MRFKYCELLLVLLSANSFVIGEETVSQLDQCIDKCVPECQKQCPEKKVCSEEQIDCGAGPTRPSPHSLCEPDRICVAKNCQCPTKDTNGEDCSIMCNVDCAEGEQFCPGTRDDKACKQPDQCVTKEKDTNGDFCPGICPMSCNDVQIKCTTPKEANGCPKAPVCTAKGKGKNGSDCPGVCPTVCKEDELLCSGGISEDGCIKKDTCVTKGTDNNGGLCSGSCPVECKDTEVHCVGPLLPNGCRMADACHPKAKNVNGEFCPANSASHNCAVTCKEDEVLCPTHQDNLGCKEEAVCTKKTKDDKGDFCPAHSVCHTPCKTHEVSCAGGMDPTGCKKPDICLPRGRDYNGELCPTHCPGDCNEDEIMCHGLTNTEGCKDPDVCVEREKKLCGPDVGGACSGHCPIECSADEIKCPSQLDVCDCCPTEEVCRPAAKDINGVNCDKESASHNCPRFCDEQSGEVLCPTYENQLGCKPKALCMMRVKGNDGNNCPSHSVCPKECGNDEMLCPDGKDSNGCKNADRCLPRGKDLDENLCPVQCPPVCEDSQVLCTGGIKGNGCKDIDVCVPKAIGKDGGQCVAVCPVTCTAAQAKVSGGDDENGCPKADICTDPKLFGTWGNDGTCTGEGDDPTCGPGTQVQKRTCTDGTIEKCTEGEKQRTVTCGEAATQLPKCPTDTLLSNEELGNEEFLLSKNGVYKATMQEDGNFVLYKDGGAIWASSTHGTGTGPYKLRMQGVDNNLVVYDKDHKATWASGTANNKGNCNSCYAKMQDDGLLVVYRGDGMPLWDSGTYNGKNSDKWKTGILITDCYKDGQNAPGNDLPDMPVTSTGVAECQYHFCNENADCNYFTYRHSDNKCWLKSSGDTLKDEEGNVSGPKSCASG